jgi:O-acetyl-ADP-ribose deacetylase (regulator of RNase III)
MIQITSGDILKADVEALVNTVNCAGVMGRGIALQFKKKYEGNFKAYKKICDAGKLRPGTMFVYDNGSLINPRFIINFPTKNHWRDKSRLEDIETGLIALTHEVRTRGIKSIAIPPLGCGLGGLNWTAVRPLIEAAFEEFGNVHVVLFEPTGTPAVSEIAPSKKKPSMTLGRSAMITLIRHYLAACMDPVVTLLEIHKLMYFVTACGEPIERLCFQKGPFGPYSENLRHVLNQTEGHFTQGFGDGADAPEKPISLLPEGLAQAQTFLEGHYQTQRNVSRVADLIAGFETPYGMELLSTVHWVCHREGARNAVEAKQRIDEWSERKKAVFPVRHIELAWNVLEHNALLPN